jgi:uncharacterized lipoprotein YajG
MKNLVYILLVSVFFLGCSEKNAIVIPTYISTAKEPLKDEKVILVAVNDQRKSKIVSIIYNDGKIQNQYPISNDLKQWYKAALQRELVNKGLYTEDIFAKVKLVVNIKKIEATYDKYSFDKDNMKLHLLLELVMKIDNQTITSNININQTVFKTLVLDASDFEKIVSEAMDTSIKRAVSIVSTKLN